MTDGLTLRLATAASALQFEDCPASAVRAARHCFLDIVGVAIAGARDAMIGKLIVLAEADGGRRSSSLFLRAGRLPPRAAALINSAAGHVLDYDDVCMAIPGHPTTTIAPAVLALGESIGATGREILTAFIAGYEVMARLGLAMAPGHYAAGFHPTGTLGAVGAAAACAHLLRLGPEATAHALGLAMSQAAGLKAVFGSPAKALQAGKAAENGVYAAQLAARGFEATLSVAESPGGFGRVHGPDFDPDRALAAEPFFVEATLFKHHAACYLTHGAIEAARALRVDEALKPEDVVEATVAVHPICLGVCDIARPRTGLEVKFSLALTTAMALADVPTERLEAYADGLCRRTDLVRLRDRIRVEVRATLGENEAEILLRTADGRLLTARHDAGVPEADAGRREARLVTKFEALVEPLLRARTAGLRDRLLQFDDLPPSAIRSLFAAHA
jgi:2-methylcitrate dehydratase PrpD